MPFASANSENGEANPQANLQLPFDADAPNTASSDSPGAFAANGMPGGSNQMGGLAPLGSPLSGRRGAHEGPVGFAGSPLDPNFTFSTFVEGSSNRMACAAARSVAEADGAAGRFNRCSFTPMLDLAKPIFCRPSHGVQVPETVA